MFLENAKHLSQQVIEIVVVDHVSLAVLDLNYVSTHLQAPLLHVSESATNHWNDALGDGLVVLGLHVGHAFSGLAKVRAIAAEQAVGVEEELLRIDVVLKVLVVFQVRVRLIKELLIAMFVLRRHA